jgi:hypothetical protein
MPVVFIEAPPGICADAKKKMVEKVTPLSMRPTTSVALWFSFWNTHRETWPRMGCNRKTRKSWKPFKESPTEASLLAKRR